MNLVRAFFPQNQGTFEILKRGMGDLPLLPPSSYAPDPIKYLWWGKLLTAIVIIFLQKRSIVDIWKGSK